MTILLYHTVKQAKMAQRVLVTALSTHTFPESPHWPPIAAIGSRCIPPFPCELCLIWCTIVFWTVQGGELLDSHGTRLLQLDPFTPSSLTKPQPLWIETRCAISLAVRLSLA